MSQTKNGSRSMITDLTQGSVTRILLVFAFPVMLSNLLQTTYNMVDMIVIGQFAGSVGLSAVSIGGDILHLCTFIVMGLANAGQVILSQYIGAGNRDKVRGTIGTMFTVIFACSIVMGVAGLLFARQGLNLLNTPEESYQDALMYVITCMCGMVFIYGYNLVSAILRGMGDSRHPFMFIAVAVVINLVLDLVLVAGFHMGAFGAALATVLGQSVSFLWAMVFLYRNREAFGFDFRLASFRVDREILIKLIKLGLPMCLQSAAITFSMMFVNAFINSYGVIASAVTGVGNKLASITSVITNAFSTAGAAMVAQCIGGEKYDRIPRIIGISAVFDGAFAILLSAMTVIFPRQVFGIFNSDAEVLAMSMTYIPVAVLSFMGFAARSPFFALINGSGNARLNLILGLMDGVVARIGLALLLGMALNFGIMGYWVGGALAGYVPFFVGGIFYLTGKWRTNALVK